MDGGGAKQGTQRTKGGARQRTVQRARASVRQGPTRKRAFLGAFAVHANVSAACRVAGIPRRTVYDWQEHDEAFALAFKQAEIESLELLEGEAFRRATEGVVSEKPLLHEGRVVGIERKVEYSDRMIELLLKARAPEKYRERASYEHTGPGGTALAPVKEIVIYAPASERPAEDTA